MQVALKQKIHYNRYTLIAMFFIVIGVLVRLVDFGNLPAGFNQDEAFAAYEAFSLINYGVDSAGNVNPTYFVSWGSGMNVLQSYLAMPFMWLFGYSEAVYRLPSLLCSIITLPVFYLLVKKLFNQKVAIIGLGILSISPWHIMLSRWGLESNLAPAFLLFGFFFLIKGIEKNVYFLLAALLYGISFYAYSINWIIVPLFLIIFGIYIIKTTKIKFGYVIASCLILIVFALPHILFLLVNADVIPEIKTSFFTIPKIVYVRSEEISLLNLLNPYGWLNLFRVLFMQYDTINCNAIAFFGMFYHISLPFFIIGIVTLFKNLKAEVKTKKLSGSYFVLSGFFVCVAVSLVVLNLNINKSNGMHLFTLAIISYGIYAVLNFVKHKKTALCVLITVFSVCFASFCGYYFDCGKFKIEEGFSGELSKAVDLVNEKKFQNVAVDYGVYHSQILAYDKTSPKEFLQTVKYEKYPYPYLKAISFGKYTFISEYNKLGNYDAYILPNSHIYFFSEEEFEITTFEKYSVAIRKLD